MVIHQPEYDKFHAALRALEPRMQLAVENHRLDPAAIEDWADSNSGLALDVEHFWMLTWPVAPLAVLATKVRELLSRWHQKLRHVHLPGYRPGFDEHRPMYCSRELVFEVLSQLAEFQFEGLVVSEVSLEFQTVNDLRMDVPPLGNMALPNTNLSPAGGSLDTRDAKWNHSHGPGVGGSRSVAAGWRDPGFGGGTTLSFIYQIQAASEVQPQ